jgi:hypothetical protein
LFASLPTLQSNSGLTVKADTTTTKNTNFELYLPFSRHGLIWWHVYLYLRKLTDPDRFDLFLVQVI